MASFVDTIYWLQSIGLADVLIPFFLTFSIVFAVLSKTDILGKEQKRFNVIVAMAMAFAVVVPHVLWGTADPANPYLTTGIIDVVKVMNNSLPQVAVTIIGIVMLMLMLGVFGVKWKLADSAGGSLVVLIAIAVVIFIFGTNAGWFLNGHWPMWLWWLADPDTQSLLISLLVFGIVVWLITREDKGDKKPFDETMKKWVQVEKLE